MKIKLAAIMTLLMCSSISFSQEKVITFGQINAMGTPIVRAEDLKYEITDLKIITSQRGGETQKDLAVLLNHGQIKLIAINVKSFSLNDLGLQVKKADQIIALEPTSNTQVRLFERSAEMEGQSALEIK